MLGREVNLKAPAVKGHRLQKVILKEGKQEDNYLTSPSPQPLISHGCLSLAKPNWKLEDKQDHQCSPFKSASSDRKKGRRDEDKIWRRDEMRSGLLVSLETFLCVLDLALLVTRVIVGSFHEILYFRIS